MRALRDLGEASANEEDRVEEMYGALRQHFGGEAFELESLQEEWPWNSFDISYTLLVSAS
jgi:hypothetical protein